MTTCLPLAWRAYPQWGRSDGSATHVTLSLLTAEEYASPEDSGVIRGAIGQCWAVKYCDIRLNHGIGLAIGDDTWAYQNKTFNNRELGMGGMGGNVSVHNNNEIYGNNFSGYTPR